MNRSSLQTDSRPRGGYTSLALSAKWASFCDALPIEYPIRANLGNGHFNSDSENSRDADGAAMCICKVRTTSDSE